MDRFKRQICIIRLWIIFSIKSLLTLSKNLKQWESSDLFVKSEAFSRLQKNFQRRYFLLWMYIKKIIDMEGLKSKLKSFYAEDFASVKHPRSRRDNRETWTKPRSGRSNKITPWDSGHIYQIWFLWEIVFFT